MLKIPQNLVVLEMANNHMGDLQHGLRVIREFAGVCKKFPQFRFAFKLQYRDLDTFIHPDFRSRQDLKYVKRFLETRLSRTEFDLLVSEMRKNGFLAMSTPFDEPSVELIENQDLDIVKIASCSFTDWPLLERVVKTTKPIIASTAGATIDEIDRVVSFLQHRNKEFVIMHCVGEYPTPRERAHVGQIDYLRRRYPGVRIGFSTHEEPTDFDLIKIAVAKGANVFEKHVGVPTAEYPLNAYSSNPGQLEKWLESAEAASVLCGVSDERVPVNQNERASLLSLRRGAFVSRAIRAGERIAPADVFFAFPPTEGQVTANEWSKYTVFTAKADLKPGAPVLFSATQAVDSRAKVLEIAQRVKAFLRESKITIPGGADLEISHHYGLESFDQFGLTMITVINRDYCKKLLIALPGQSHPEQYHKKKEETFHVLHGSVSLWLNGEESKLGPGDVLTVEPNVRHSFKTETGCIIEEISSTHYVNDSFYTDELISKNPNRKTLLTYWMTS